MSIMQRAAPACAARIRSVVLAGAIAAALLGGVARAQDNPVIVADALDANVQAWMSFYQVQSASVAAMKDGVIVKSYGHGDLDASKAADVASLSKAVTAVCIAGLIDQGKLAFSDTLAKLLPDVFAKVGQPKDPRFLTITVEQLLQHESGMPREPVPGPKAASMMEQFTRAVNAPLDTNPGTKRSYSNDGYLTLGVIVETITKRDYQSACLPVLTAMGATGSIDPNLKERAPNGGWRMSAIDYAKFYQAFDPKSTILGQVSRTWMTTRSDNPTYALGTYVRRTSRGLDIWHDGKVSLRSGGGSYAVKLDDGWTGVVIFSGRNEGDVYDNLYRRMLATMTGP